MKYTYVPCILCKFIRLNNAQCTITLTRFLSPRLQGIDCCTPNRCVMHAPDKVCAYLVHSIMRNKLHEIRGKSDQNRTKWKKLVKKKKTTLSKAISDVKSGARALMIFVRGGGGRLTNFPNLFYTQKWYNYDIFFYFFFLLIFLKFIITTTIYIPIWVYDFVFMHWYVTFL